MISLPAFCDARVVCAVWLAAGATFADDLAPDARTAAPQYTLTVLAPIPGKDISEPIAISNAARVAVLADSPLSAWAWDGGYEELPGLGGDRWRPFAINRRGDIVGLATLPGGDVARAVRWSPAAIEILPIPAGAFHTFAMAINDHGTIVGLTDSEHDEAVRVVLWHGGKFNDLGPLSLGGQSDETWPRAINNRGRFVGTAQTASGATHAFLHENGRMIDLGTLGGDSSAANDINDRGVVVGFASASPLEHFAVRWVQGEIEPLGTLGPWSLAMAINSSGEVVGNAELPDGRHAAFLWRRGVMYSLTDLLPHNDGSVTIRYANDINDGGQIVGLADVDGELVGALLTPVIP